MTETIRTNGDDKSKTRYAADETDLAAAVQALEAALAANTETQIKAQAGQAAELKDEIRALNRTLVRIGDGD